MYIGVVCVILCFLTEGLRLITLTTSSINIADNFLVNKYNEKQPRVKNKILTRIRSDNKWQVCGAEDLKKTWMIL